MGLDKADAVAICSAFTGLVYLTPLAGGWLADRIFGARLTVLAGTLTIAVGYVLMATGQVHSFALGLVVLAVGIGLFKGNIAAMVGAYSTPHRHPQGFGLHVLLHEREPGFPSTGPLIGGWVAVQHGWRAGPRLRSRHGGHHRGVPGGPAPASRRGWAPEDTRLTQRSCLPGALVIGAVARSRSRRCGR